MSGDNKIRKEMQDNKMNFSAVLNEYVSEPFEEYFREPASQASFIVLFEMTLSLIGTVLNLTIIIPVLEQEELMVSTLNVLMANLSLANLTSTVFVKLIGVIYHGYAIAKSR